ncbi:hypothetical protein ACCO45_003851 [Purpureocillium lilacinum]|uniref:Uncharacterized protein n=1 Tax=Purpureocillium lilacinum TaxID=33203 RepID=A0ACC4E274_PURLI
MSRKFADWRRATAAHPAPTAPCMSPGRAISGASVAVCPFTQCRAQASGVPAAAAAPRATGCAVGVQGRHSKTPNGDDELVVRARCASGLGTVRAQRLIRGFTVYGGNVLHRAVMSSTRRLTGIVYEADSYRSLLPVVGRDTAGKHSYAKSPRPVMYIPARVSRQRAQVPNAYLPPASLGQHQRYLEPIAAPLHCSTSAAPQHRAPQVALALPPLLLRVAINHPIAPARIAAQSLSTVLQLLRKRQLLWADLSVVAARAPRTTNARDARAPLELHHSPAHAHARELHCASTCRCLGRCPQRPAQARNVADSYTPARPLISAAARSPVTPRPRHEHSPPAATASHPRCISASLHLPATRILHLATGACIDTCTRTCVKGLPPLLLAASRRLQLKPLFTSAASGGPLPSRADFMPRRAS